MSLLVGCPQSRTLNITSIPQVVKQRKQQKRVKLDTPYPTFAPLSISMQRLTLTSPFKTPVKAEPREFKSSAQTAMGSTQAASQVPSAFTNKPRDKGDYGPMDHSGQ